MIILPYLVETIVDLQTPRKWWNHLVRRDQSQRAARPLALFATVLIKPIPFACLYALLSLGSPMGLMVLGLTVAIRLMTTGIILRRGLQDREGLLSLWLVPFRDIAALASWGLAFTQRTTVWRHSKCILTANGRLVAQHAGEGHDSLRPKTTSNITIPVKKPIGKTLPKGILTKTSVMIGVPATKGSNGRDK